MPEFTIEQLVELLIADAEAFARDENTTGLRATPLCVPFPRIQRALSQELLSESEKQHISGCRYCGSAMKKLASPVGPTEIAEFADRSVPSEISSAINVWAAKQPAWPVTQIRSTEIESQPPLVGPERWSLSDAEDAEDPLIHLTSEQSTRFFGERGISVLRVWLHVEARPGEKASRVALAIDPGPTETTLSIDLNMPSTGPKTFVFPPNEHGRLREAVAILECADSHQLDLNDSWPASLAIRED
jgi:hypothetical protein